MQAEMATNYGLIMAGAALAAVPIVTVFLVFQKSFTTRYLLWELLKDNTLRKSNSKLGQRHLAILKVLPAVSFLVCSSIFIEYRKINLSRYRNIFYRFREYRGYKCLQNVGYFLTLEILLDTYQLKNDFS